MGTYIDSNKSRYPVAAGVKIAARDMVYINPTGYAAPAPAPGAGVVGTVVGNAIADYDNTGGADRAFYVTVEHSCGARAFLYPAAALTIADAGKKAYVGATPQTLTTVATNAVFAGILQGIEEDDGRGRVIFPL